MTFLAPLGFLAAISIIILIIIYIIKPNYQQKYISSTFVWKLSLKYKKKKVPTSKLRDILIVICQVAILALCSTVLANPSQLQTAFMGGDEVVFIIDSSASMRVKVNADGSSESVNGETRYDRALRMLESTALAANTRGAVVSIIRAGDKPEMIVERATGAQTAVINEGLSELRGIMDSAKTPFEQYGGCGYGKSDINAALTLCEDRVLANNPIASIAIYTDSTFTSVPQGIEVVDCRVMKTDEEGKKFSAEWNAAVLDVKAEYVENYYAFTVKIASYGRASRIGIRLDLRGVNGSAYDDGTSGENLTINYTAEECNDSEEKEIIFYKSETLASASANAKVVRIEGDGVFSYESVTVRLSDPDASTDSYIPIKDDFSDDNTFILPGGTKPTLRFHYASNMRTPFFVGMLDYLQGEYYKDKWKIEVDTYKPGDRTSSIKSSGFDFYIYEGVSGEEIGTLPNDGVSLFVGCPDFPNGVSVGYQSRLGDGTKSNELAAAAEGHPLMSKITAELITISYGYGLSIDDYSGYTSLMTLGDYPVCAVSNSPNEKVVVLSFSLAYSNFSILPDFALFIRNAVDYFIPATIEKNVYEVGEDIGFECRGQTVKVSPANVSDVELEQKSKTFDTFPVNTNIYKSGRYTVSTLFDSDTGREPCEQEIFVKMPQEESNINRVADALEDPYHGATLSDIYRDLAFYFALAIVFFVFAEWLLHLREGI